MNPIRTLAAATALSALAAAFTPTVSAAPKPVLSLEDPLNDANFVNDQGTSDGTFGDFNQAGADASAFADIVSVSFSNDKKNLYVHIETESTAQPTAGEGFRVRTNPVAGGVYCLNFEIFFNGAQNTVPAATAHLRDACSVATAEATVALDIYGGYTITVPRSAHEAFAKGGSLTAPQAQTFLYSGPHPPGVVGPYFDTTKVGTDYKLKK